MLVTIFDHMNTGSWSVVNDDVMGGVSKSLIRFSEDRKLTFSGIISLDNNGGFASTRMDLGDLDLSGCNFITIRLKGDGKKYKIQLMLDRQWNDIRYTFEFKTVKDVWMEVQIPKTDFKPTYRGRILSDTGKQEFNIVRNVGLLISDKQEGPFSVVVQWIKCN